MLFMVMHKTNAQLEAAEKPTPELIEQMGRLMGETVEKGQLHNAAGLKRSAERVRLQFKAGECKMTRGPLRGENELIAGFAMLQVKSMDEAIAWSKRFAEVIGDVEIDVGPVTERWDLGLMEKPSDAPLRVLAMHKADASSEADEPPSAAMMAKMGALMAEMKAAGVLLATEGLRASKHGARLRTSGAKHRWTDGPFAESKELISGFCIIKVSSLEEAKAWTTRYATILQGAHGDIEVDVRLVH